MTVVVGFWLILILSSSDDSCSGFLADLDSVLE